MATNALEHNFLSMIMGAVYVAGLVMTGYDMYETYQEEGALGAAKVGVIEGTTTLAVGGSLKLAGKAIKYGVNAVKRVPVKNVKNTEIGITWGKGIQQQGMPWEEYLAKSLPMDARLPKNFKTFDFYDMETKVAISAKTLNTGSAKKIADPTKVYQSLKKNIDNAANFVEHKLNGVRLNSDKIINRRLDVAIPKNTTIEQWKQIGKAAEYSKGKGIDFNITVVK